MQLRRRVIFVVFLAGTSLANAAVQSQPAHSAIDAAKIDKYMLEQIQADQLPSLSIGIVYDQDLVYAKAYGVADRKANRPATPETIYRIGSATKVFTTTLLCILRDKGVVRLDDPASKYLPAEVRLPTDPRGAPATTLRHLATHSSGLPRIPGDLDPKAPDPYADCTLQRLFAILPKTPLLFPIGGGYSYSNLGMGLLGVILERAAGEPYEALLRKHLLDPMQMNNTAIKLSPKQRALFASGYEEEDTTKEAVDWDLASLVAAGALGSNVPDLARFLSLQMRAGQAGVTPVSGGTLTELHTPQRLVDGNWMMSVGLGWHIKHDEKSGDIVWHNGGVAGYHSFMGFVPRSKVGVIVLTNCGKSVDEIGGWLVKAAADASQGTVPPQAQMPSAAEILDKYVEAVGGVKAYESIRAAVTHSKGSIMSMPVTLEEYMASPNRYYSRLNMGPLGTIEQGSDGRTAWTIQGGQAEVLEGNDREEMLREANLLKDVRWRDLYSSAKNVGAADFEGHRCYKVMMTPNKGSKQIRHYDVRTGLLVGQETVEEVSGKENVSAVHIYDDYRKFGPLLYPAKIILRAGGVDLLLTVENVEWNAEIPASRFDLPAEVKALLKENAASQPAAPATQPGR